jgi:hypothetical protein
MFDIEVLEAVALLASRSGALGGEDTRRLASDQCVRDRKHGFVSPLRCSNSASRLGDDGLRRVTHDVVCRVVCQTRQSIFNQGLYSGKFRACLDEPSLCGSRRITLYALERPSAFVKRYHTR